MSSGPGYPSNLFSCPGEISPQDSIARITEALCMGRETLNKTLRLYEVGVKKCAQCNCKNSSHFLSKPITDFDTTVSKTLSCFINSELLHKLPDWWQATLGDTSNAHASIGKGKGLLFTNQLPVGTSKYAARRADNQIVDAKFRESEDPLRFARFALN